MFLRLGPESDLERSAGQEDLQFDDPSWIIDHHRRNIILKIFKPEGASSLIQHVVDTRYNASEIAGWAEDLRQYGKPDLILSRTFSSTIC